MRVGAVPNLRRNLETLFLETECSCRFLDLYFAGNNIISVKVSCMSYVCTVDRTTYLLDQIRQLRFGSQVIEHQLLLVLVRHLDLLQRILRDCLCRDIGQIHSWCGGFCG